MNMFLLEDDNHNMLVLPSTASSVTVLVQRLRADTAVWFPIIRTFAPDFNFHGYVPSTLEFDMKNSLVTFYLYHPNEPDEELFTFEVTKIEHLLNISL